MQRKIFTLSAIILTIFWVYEAVLLYTYATDVPFWDTWEQLPRGEHKHLFEFYNENMQFFYFLISEVIYKTTNWNLRWFNFINFVLYTILLLVYWKILYEAQKQKRVPFYPLFLGALLTPMLGYNWLWPVLVQTHTFILFFLLSIYWGYTCDKEKYSPYACGICLFLSIISMNIPLALGGCIAYTVKEIVNAKQQGKITCLKKCTKMLITLIVLFGGLACVTNVRQFITIKLSNNIWTLEYIYNLAFYTINSLSLFYLADIINWKISLMWFVIHFSILAVVFFEQYRDKKIQSLWGILFGVLFCVCGIVSFRGGEVYSYHLGFIRHNETTFMLLPATLMVLFLSRKKWVRYYAVCLMVLMFYGIASDIRAQRFQFFGKLFYQNGCLCLNHYYNLKTIDTWQCTMNFPVAPDQWMEKGKEKNLSFIKTIEHCQ